MNPILLAAELTSGSFLSCLLLHPDRQTLPHLTRWYSNLHEAIFLIQLGDLHYLKGKRACALHRDWEEHWVDVQPRLSSSKRHLTSIARSLKIQSILLHDADGWKPINKSPD
ncbi:hypothetical protein NX722_03740 [Endozoicomonas gorgoniicola]|uniref:Uncharacterized protein n=1 Tax=Endozoicomonas gorgoniicola TaxID=1234144 RepID=A0ABT3MQW2_9GAMM|nr:hypothetical protein [Endozoicomonas gorgoniicola]MCW7551765.1 hypothetical protein [Endozoicomonas gorgoniicola]